MEIKLEAPDVPLEFGFSELDIGRQGVGAGKIQIRRHS